MPGLLDARGGFNDPITMGLLGASQALLTPMSQGGGLGAAFGAFPAAQQQAQQQALRQQYMRQQMEGMQSEAELRRSQLMAAQEKARRDAEQARRDAEQIARQRDILGGIAGPRQMGFRDANIAITGVAPAGYQPPEQRNAITQDVVAQWVAAGGDPDVLKKLAESGDWGRAEVARVLDTADQQGRPQQQQFDRFGRPVGSMFAKPYEKKMVNTGGAQVGYDPYTLGLTGQSIANTMTPGEVASNRVAQGNLGVAQARLAMDKQNSGINNGQVLPDQGIIVDKKTGATIPILVDGKPMVPAGKAPTEAQTKDNLFATRADAANKIVVGLGNKPSVNAVNIKQGLADFPLIGGSLGTGANALLSNESQQYEQAKRDFINAVLRKESGAVIGKDEFASADLQYFPQPFDSDAVKTQKTANRQRAIDGIALGAGPLGRPAKDDPLGLRR